MKGAGMLVVSLRRVNFGFSDFGLTYGVLGNNNMVSHRGKKKPGPLPDYSS